MNEVLYNTIKTVFALAAMQGKKLCFSPSDGQFYEVKSRQADGCTLYPLGGVGDDAASPIFHLNPSELLFGEDLLAESRGNAFQTLKNAFETQSKRDENADYDADETLSVTQSEREDNAPETLDNVPETSVQREVIGRGKVDLPRFSHLYAGDIAKTCADIETYLDKIFASTNYAPTIKKTIANYQLAKQLANDGNLYELTTLSYRLVAIINKQRAMSNAMSTVAARQSARRRMTLSLTLLVVGVAVGFYLHFSDANIDELPAVQQSATVAVVPESVFDATIEEWQRIHNRKIYPTGRECLRKACSGITDKAAIMAIIDKNMK